jgi:hypothetical protein
LKEALRSKYVLNGWLLLVISIPSLISVPLTEARGSIANFLLLFSISIITSGVAVGFMLSFRGLYASGKAAWWFSVVLSAIAGSLKSGSTWVLVDSLALEQPGLWSRLLVGGLSWAIIYPAFVVIGHSLLRLRDENRELRASLLQARQGFSQLDQQLNWLIQTRIQGLSDELAKRFVGLVSKLNSQGAGPGAYRDIAAELRSAALKQVRSRSAEVWSARTKPTLKELVSDFRSTAAKPLLTVALFSISAGINNIRIFGIGLEAASVVVSSIILLVWLWALRNKPALQHFAGPLASAVLLPLLLALDFTPLAALSGAIATLIWMQAVILFSISWSLALGLARKESEALKTAASTAEADSQWLAIQLESTNLEIAKYLHAILQTRLMAYAMKLDSSDVPSQSDLDDLKALLMKPMGEFGQQSKDLGQGLSELKQNWGVLVEVSVVVDADEETLVEPTLQVVREAVANSIKHGLADHVEVEIRDQQNLRMVLVMDNGIGPRTGRAGLGTKVFSSLTKEHSLTRNQNGGSTFAGVLEI